MAGFHEFEVAYVAPVTFVRQRARNEQTLNVLAHTRVRIPEVGAADAPIALLGHVNGRRRIERRLLDGRLVLPQGIVWTEPDGRLIMTIPTDGLLDILANPADNVDVLFGSHEHCPWTRPAADKARPLPMGVARIVADRRDEVERQVQAAARRLVSVDGLLYQEDELPRLTLAHQGGMAMGMGIWHDRGSGKDGFAFRLDRIAEFEDFVGRCRDLGFDIPRYDLNLTVEATTPEGLAFDEERHNALHALRLALVLAGQELGDLPPEAVSALADVSATRQEILAREAAPGSAALALEGLAAMLPGGRAPIRAAVACGLEALSRSLPSHEFEPVDADAFEGLAL